jgi:hypothetical protein
MRDSSINANDIVQTGNEIGGIRKRGERWSWLF